MEKRDLLAEEAGPGSLVWLYSCTLCPCGVHVQVEKLRLQGCKALQLRVCRAPRPEPRMCLLFLGADPKCHVLKE